MELITITIIAIGLATDAFVVSIVSGSTYRKLHIKHALRMAIFFGAFQAFMPLIGSLAGLSLKDCIQDYDHWVAFALLAAVGGKMIYESFKIKSVEENPDPSNILVLLVLSIATSIDALAIGITLSFITSSIALAVIIIGLITFALSYAGVLIGKRFGHFFENKIEALGGFVLICIGVKILCEHLLF
jgi:putative Mn2+ efflux pump MntP